MEEAATVVPERSPKFESGFAVIRAGADAVGWQFNCARCKQGVTSSKPLQPGKELRIYCCGEWKNVSFDQKQISELPVVNLRPRTFPDVAVGMARRDASEVSYVESSAF